MSYSFHAAKTNKQFKRERERGREVKARRIKRKLCKCRDIMKERKENGMKSLLRM